MMAKYAPITVTPLPMVLLIECRADRSPDRRVEAAVAVDDGDVPGGRVVTIMVLVQGSVEVGEDESFRGRG